MAYLELQLHFFPLQIPSIPTTSTQSSTFSISNTSSKPKHHRVYRTFVEHCSRAADSEADCLVTEVAVMEERKRFCDRDRQGALGTQRDNMGTC